MTLLFAGMEDVLPAGMIVIRGVITEPEQVAILDALADVMQVAPPFRPQMPTGAFMVNRLTNCGEWGWLSDRRGYRYETAHPDTGRAWPPIPEIVRERAVDAAAQAGYVFEPDACLVNIYEADGKLGMHRDGDELDFSQPIVSMSFGNQAEFCFGGLDRGGRTTSLTIGSGDILVFGGPSRLRYHGVRRIRTGTSPVQHAVLPKGGRINLTLRRAK